MTGTISTGENNVNCYFENKGKIKISHSLFQRLKTQ